MDNCPAVANPSQSNIDLDSAGDVCDVCPADIDNLCNTGGSAAADVTSAGGGTVKTPDGQLEIVIEPGDLPADTTVAITEEVSTNPEVGLTIGTNPGLGQAIAFYDLEPDGLQFASPVTLHLLINVTGLNQAQRQKLKVYRLDDTSVPPDGIEDTFVPLQLVGDKCPVTETEDPPGTFIFIADCSVQLDHFSSYAIIVPLDGDNDGIPNSFEGEVDNCPLTSNPGQSDYDLDGLGDACDEGVDFGGFRPPVDPLPTFNSMKAGAAVPVKFSLAGDQGLQIFAVDYPRSHPTSCDAINIEDAIETTVTAGSSSLTYDPATDQYSYIWKTNKAWAGTCRQFVIRFFDGSEARANFKFR